MKKCDAPIYIICDKTEHMITCNDHFISLTFVDGDGHISNFGLVRI